MAIRPIQSVIRFAKVLGARTRRVAATYEAAQTHRHNENHWIAADHLRARAANSPEVRRMLRALARYEVANNSYDRGIVNTLANDTAP